MVMMMVVINDGVNHEPLDITSIDSVPYIILLNSENSCVILFVRAHPLHFTVEKNFLVT